jgi:hypothetical protein
MKNAVVPIIKNNKNEALNKLQKDFNQKVLKIKELKEKIVEIENQVQFIKQKLQTELIPYEREAASARVELVKSIDTAIQNIKFSRTEREALRETLIDHCFELISVFKYEELIPIYDRYSQEGGYEKEVEEMDKEAKKQASSMFKNAFGKDINLEDLTDEEAFETLHRTAAEMEEEMKQQAWEKKQKQQNKKKSPKQAAAEEKRRLEAEQLNKTTRSIYTELAKEIHPDLEQDEEKRTWKTEIMKQITQAYENDDLYELLRLQLEYRQMENKLDQLPEERLKYYVKILNDQVKALNEQIYMITSPFSGIDSRLIDLGLGGTKNQINYRFRNAKKEINENKLAALDAIKHLQRADTAKRFANDLARSRRQQSNFDMDSMMDMLSGMFDTMGEMGNQRKNKKRK